MVHLNADKNPLLYPSLLIDKKGLVLFFLFSLFFLEAKPSGMNIQTEVKCSPLPSSVVDTSMQLNTRSLTIYWDQNIVPSAQGHYSFSISSPIVFTFLAVGWKTLDPQPDPGDFQIRYRTRSPKKLWTDWKASAGTVSPGDSPSGFYWSDILFVMDSVGHSECELELIAPEYINLDHVRVDLVGIEKGSINGKSDPLQTKNKAVSSWTNLQQGCTLPEIITRDGWCGSYPNCPKPAYQPVPVQANHVLIHHGGSPNLYSDGATLVRSYWFYHVYSNGWDDIGYHFLIDKDGHIFQGRYNPDFPDKDVKGAHAGFSNTRSIGICLLGNTDSIPVTDIQVLNLERLLTWWFQSRGFDPTTKAEIIDQAGEKTLFLPRIIGHREVKPATLCPGNSTYLLLPTIRHDTKKRLIACSGNLPQYDISIVKAKTGNTNYVAGDSILVQYSLSLYDANQNQNNAKIHTSFWLSADSLFNPGKDIFLGQNENNFCGTKDGCCFETASLAIDSAMLAENYFLFLVADYFNLVYESDETNNEIFVPLKIDRLNFEIVASVNPDKGILSSRQGWFYFGETCTLEAEANFGYEFLGWYENEKLIFPGKRYSFKVSKGRKLKAEFACKAEPDEVLISGDTQVCSGQTGAIYEIKDALNALSYQWTLPEGATGLDQGNSIWVNFGNEAQSGFVIAAIGTRCFGALETTLPVTVKPAPAPPSIHLELGVLRASDNRGIAWFWDDDRVIGVSGQYYIPSGKGIFYAVSEQEGCLSSASNTIEFDPAEIKDKENPFFFKAFPNPGPGIFEVILSKTCETRSKFEVSDFNGKVVKRIDNPVGTRFIRIDLTGYPVGIYLIRMITGKGYFSGKILITNN